MKKTINVVLSLVLLCSITIRTHAQSTIGQPDINNYPHEKINGGSQSWAIGQDKIGNLYFANNSGLLCFNSKEWKLYQLPNKTIVRALSIGDDGKIFVGGQDELGYFFPNLQGSLQYQSLLAKLPITERRFGDVWNIIQHKDVIYFRTGSKILTYHSKKQLFSLYAAPKLQSWSFMGNCKQRIFAQLSGGDLQEFTNNTWVTVKSFKGLITAILPFDHSTIQIFTLQHGVFLLNKDGLKPANIAAEVTNSQIQTVWPIDTTQYAVGTVSNGIYLINKSGKVLRNFSGLNGLQNNNVLSLFIDYGNILWAGLDEGIATIDHSSPLQKINRFAHTATPVYATSIFNHQLYIATSDGVFTSTIEPQYLHTSISLSKANFYKIANTHRQVWSLYPYGNQMLMGHHNGAFTLKDKALPILGAKEGFWLFRPIPNTKTLICGTYKGIQLLKQVGENLVLDPLILNNVNDPLRFVEIDFDRNLVWASHPYRGIYKIHMDKHFTKIIKSELLGTAQGLPKSLNNFVFKARNQIVFTTEKGIYEYEHSSKRFIKSRTFTPLFGDLMIKFLVTDTKNRVWFATEKDCGVLDNGKIKYFPELKGKLVAGFENINPISDQNILIATYKGITHLNYSIYSNRYKSLKIQLNKVIVSGGNNDSLLFDGHFQNKGRITASQPESMIHQLPALYSSYHFEYGSDRYGSDDKISYSYQLIGYDNTWSNWTEQSSKDYTNLPYGRYVFRIKAKDNIGNLSAIQSYTFEILPRWYQTKIAYFLYLLTIVALVYLALHYHKKRLKKQKISFLEKQAHLKYVHELELEKNDKEIVKLKNERLEAEMSYKNKELASTTMHLYNHSRLLNKIKEELNAISAKSQNREQKNDLNKLLKLLLHEERQEHNWEQFSIHFDEVHNKFLQKLKSDYPDLTSGDLKLCAYLKMNLSSKEIAQLLHFSIKGVENGRYRLRKKFNIPNGESLSDFILRYH